MIEAEMKLATLSLAATLLLLAGCQLKWVTLDGAKPDEARLEKAMSACRVDRKLAALERAGEESKETIAQTKDRDRKQQLKNQHEEVRVTVYREIDACMRRQGYKR